MGLQKEKRRVLAPGFVAGPSVASLAQAPILRDPAHSGLGVACVAHFKYRFATDGGALGEIIPKDSPTLPSGAIVIGGLIRVSTALLAAGGAATISFGTHAGSGVAALLGATAKATWAINALLDLIPVYTAATAVRLTAAGQLSMTVATNALTAGEFEAWVFYVVTAK